jgi:hypothetical protein
MSHAAEKTAIKEGDERRGIRLTKTIKFKCVKMHDRKSLLSILFLKMCITRSCFYRKCDIEKPIRQNL